MQLREFIYDGRSLNGEQIQKRPSVLGGYQLRLILPQNCREILVQYVLRSDYEFAT